MERLDKVNIEELKTDLMFARKSSGLKLSRVHGMIDVLEIALNTENESFSLLKQRLIKAIYLIDDEDIITIMLSMFSIKKKYQNIHLLRERRKLLCQQLNIGVDKILFLEKAGIDELVVIILKIYQKKIAI
jgi:hypothetical protein